MMEIEERLHRLTSRRQVLESKYKSQMITLSEFANVRKEKMHNVIEATKKQNEAARKRNMKLIRDVGSAVTLLSSSKVYRLQHNIK